VLVFFLAPVFSDAAEASREQSKALSKLDSFFHPLLQVTRNWQQPLGALSEKQVQSSARQLRLSSPEWAAGQMLIDDQARVQVYVKVHEWEDHYPEMLKQMGCRVELVKPEIRVIQCSIPADRLLEAAELDWVKLISKPYYGIYTHTLTQAGENTIRHEGELLPRFDKFRQETGIDGTGYKVGVISDGIARIAESQAAGELPDVTAESFRGDGNLATGGEGTAILEQLHDILPGAKLYFSNNDSELTFVESINWLADRCDVIAGDEVFTGLGPEDGDSYVERAMTKAAEKTLAITWAAGNAARNHYQAYYWDPDGDGWHNFSSNKEYVTCSVKPGGTLMITLSWDDHFLMERMNDFSLQAKPLDIGYPILRSQPYKLNAGIEPIGDSFSNLGYPVELLTYENKSGEREYFRVYIDGPWDPQHRLLKLSINGNKGGRLEEFIVPQNSIGSIAVSKGITTSGAYDSITACTETGAELGEDSIGSWAYTIEPFSSFGWTSDGRMLPSTCFPDRINTYSDFWNWDLQETKLDHASIVVEGGKGSSMTCDDAAAYDVVLNADGSASFNIVGQDIKLSSVQIDDLNEYIQTTSSSGMTMHITGGAPSPDLIESHETLEAFRDVQLQLEYSPEELVFQQKPGEYVDKYIELTNPHSSLTVPGNLVFDPRSLMVKVVEFQVEPKENLKIRVRTRPSLTEGVYQSTIYILHHGSDTPIEIPVTVMVHQEASDGEIILQEREPNNPLRLDHLFAFAQALPLPLSTENKPGPPMLKVKGHLSTQETGLKPGTNREDMEDWYTFEVPESATQGIELTLSCTPDNPQADVDLAIMVNYDTVWRADREKNGWPETIGPLTLQPGNYAIGVGIYDYNLPNMDATFDPQQTGYELTILREPTEPADSAFPKNTSAKEVAAFDENVVFLINEYDSSYLVTRTLQEGSFVTGDGVKGHFWNLQKSPLQASRAAVIASTQAPGSVTRTQVLRLYDFSDLNDTRLIREIVPGDLGEGCTIHDYALSNAGNVAFVHAELPGNTTGAEYFLASYNLDTGEQLDRLDLGHQGKVHFDIFRQHEYAAFQSSATGAVYHYNFDDPENIKLIAEIPSTLLRTFTTSPDGTYAYYVSWNDYKAFFEVNLQTHSKQRLPTSDEILALYWPPLEDKVIVVGPRNMLMKTKGSGSYQSVMYPDIGTGTKYFPGEPVFMSANYLAMPIHENEFMVADLETRTATFKETSGHLNDIDYSLNEGGIFYAGGGRLGFIPVSITSKIRQPLEVCLGRDVPAKNLRNNPKTTTVFQAESMPELFAYPSMVGFGNVESGTHSRFTAEVWIRNTGRVAAHVYEMNWDSPAFKVLNPITSETAIEPGQAYKLEIISRPVQPGLEQELLQIVTDNFDDPNLYVMMSVSGTPGSSFVAGDLDGDRNQSLAEWGRAASFYQQYRDNVQSPDLEDFDQVDGYYDGKVDEKDFLLMLKGKNSSQ
jgi:hypothetical protein